MITDAKYLKIIFLNHASFLIESNESILILDPWLEGNAFFNGWSLIDKSTSNKKLKDLIKEKKKKVFIWYSHEHSDHLSFSFLKSIKKINLSILFQNTIDKRVSSALKENKFHVEDLKNGVKKKIDENISITTWSWKDGDSFCLIKVKDFIILNLNDCNFQNYKDFELLLKKIRKYKLKIDILFTQFGYANWIGNETDSKLRIKASEEKLNRLKMQNLFIKPKYIIPFASFIHFCHQENMYMNDYQNTPLKVLNSEKTFEFRENILFLKPYDSFSLGSKINLGNDLKNLSSKSVIHWENLFKKEFNIIKTSKNFEFNKLKKSFIYYKTWANKMSFYLPILLEYFKFIKPIKVLITDNNQIFELSYINGLKKTDNKIWNISLSFEVLNYIFENEYGLNTTQVNARFRSNNISPNKNKRLFYRFFLFQELIKNGYNISNPVQYCLKITFLFFTKLKRISKFFN